MKLLVTSETCSNIYELSHIFRAKGIATYIAENDAPLPGVYAGLWIVLDSQYHDALMLYNNPSHKVARPLSDEEVMELGEKAKEFSAEKLNGISGVLFAVSIVLLVMFIGGAYGWFYLMEN